MRDDVALVCASPVRPGTAPAQICLYARATILPQLRELDEHSRTSLRGAAAFFGPVDRQEGMEHANKRIRAAVRSEL